MLPKARREIGHGDRIGPYLVERRLGEGGMAEVFSATDTRSGGPVALKRSLFTPSSAGPRTEMFAREALIACTLLHPNIVRTYGMVEDDLGNPVLVMELLEGLTAKTLGPDLRKARDGVRLSTRIMQQAARALDHLHTVQDPELGGLVHRDVSPDNLLVTLDGTVKLLDFGLAKHQDDGRLTNAGMLKGKAAYMAPEQIASQPLDHRTDQYALATTFYALCTGRCPYERENVPNTLDAVLGASLVPISALDARMPARADAVVARGLAREMAARYPSCTAFATALADAIGLPRDGDDGRPDLAQHVLAALGRVPVVRPGSTAVEPRPVSYPGVSDPSLSFGFPEEVTSTPVGRADSSMLAADEKTFIEPRHPNNSGPDTAPGEQPEFRSSDDDPPDVTPQSQRGAIPVVSAPSQPPGPPIHEMPINVMPRPPPSAGGGENRTSIVKRDTGTREKSDSAKDLIPVRPELELHGNPKVTSPLFSIPQPQPSGVHRLTRWPIAIALLILTSFIVTAAVLSAFDAGPTRADAGPRAARAERDAGPVVARTALDSGPDDATMPADAAGAAPVADGATSTRKVKLAGPAWVEWRVGERVLGNGTVKMELDTDVTAIVARDTRRGAELTIPAPADFTGVDYNKLPRTEVRILVRPWADVSLGEEKLGTTPLKPLMLLPGKYRLRLSNSDSVQEQEIDVVEGPRQDFRFRFE